MTDKQLKMQEAILLAVHPWCTIEQAREKELVEWCMVDVKWWLWEKEWISKVIEYEREQCKIVWCKTRLTTWIHFSIIGLPPTLERTLVALGDVFWKWHRIIRLENKIVCIHRERLMQNRNFEDLCDRKLINSDWTPCDLFQQDISTQDTIYSILCKDE